MAQMTRLPSHRRAPRTRRVLILLLVVLLIVLGGVLISVQMNDLWPLAQAQLSTSTTTTPTPGDLVTLSAYTEEPSETETATHVPTSATPSATDEPTPSQTSESETDNTSTNTPESSSATSDVVSNQFPYGLGTLFMSQEEGGYSHIFAYHPLYLPFTRLTSGPWDDITPAASPDGTRLAFSSNRDGYWDLYLLDLPTGLVTRITDTTEYDSSPSWSPDGRWLVYETYIGENPGDLELFIRQAPDETTGDQEPHRLTNNPGADHSPVWSPQGRHIAFVSDRSGESEIWLADLDLLDDRFQNISQRPQSLEMHPAWSPDGSALAWVSEVNGFQSLYVWEVTNAGHQSDPRYVGSGNWPVWSPNGDAVVTSLLAPNRVYLTGYALHSPGVVLPPIALNGFLNGLTWGSARLPESLPTSLNQAARLTPTPVWQPALTPVANIPGGRQQVVSLIDVDAPYPVLQDLVDESFQALRTRLTTEIGWDFLSTLENAYVPISAPLFPGMLGDWLYTGRAFAINPVTANAGWMVVVREDFALTTYWRLYLRTRFQDGSQGSPLHDLPWNFNARTSGDPRFYEQGGALVDAIPSGYWLDFTQLAAGYGWERLPALSTWRSAFSAARFNEFVLTDGLDWHSAMLEIYPPEAVVTQTPVIPPTYTPTTTLRPSLTPTPTRTRWPSRTPTPAPGSAL